MDATVPLLKFQASRLKCGLLEQIPFSSFFRMCCLIDGLCTCSAKAGDVHIEVQFTELSAEQIAELRCSHTNAATDPVIANAAANAAFKSLEAILFTQSPQCQAGTDPSLT